MMMKEENNYAQLIWVTKTQYLNNDNIITSRVLVEGKSAVCVWFLIIYNILNYYHDRPEPNIIIVYYKHITHARTHTRKNALEVGVHPIVWSVATYNGTTRKTTQYINHYA